MSADRGSWPDAEAALARVPGMGGARVCKRLSDGPTNASFSVERQGARHVLRLDKAEAAVLGLDRESERQVCLIAAEAGLGPEYTHFDSRSGVSLRPFIDGTALTPADLARRETLAAVAGCLRRLHRLPPTGRKFDPLCDANRYAEQLDSAAARDLARRAASALAAARPAPAAPALCHNDPVCGNIIRSENSGLVLIDWEYAGIGDPYFDLAVVVRHHDLGSDLARHFLEAYLQRGPTEAEWRHLNRQCEFYGCLLALWNERICVDWTRLR